MLLAVVAVLVSVFFVATGWGGEMSYERPDHAPLDLGPVSATDIALMRPPTALWGYNMQVTDEALELIARAVRDRDVTIAALQQQLAELGPGEPPAVQPPEPRQAPEAAGTAQTLPSSDVRLPPYLRQPSGTQPSGTQPSGTQAAEPPAPTEPNPTVESPPHAGAALTAESPAPAETGQSPTVPSTRSFLRASPPPQAPHVPPPLSAPPVTQARPPKAPARPAASQGPQGSYDAHGWWAEEQRAARAEQADDPSSDVDPPAAGHDPGPAGAAEDESTAAEEQGW
jgi:hypothetical protein